MAGIGELSVAITARTEKALRNIKNFRKGINKLPGAIGKAATSMGGMATAAAGLVGVGAIGSQISKSFENIDNLAKTSDKLGIATDKLAAYRMAAEESGVGVQAFDTSLQRMVRRIAEAAQGTGEAKNAIAELGLDAQKLGAMSPDQQFSAIADAMSGVASQGDKVRLAMKLFDSEGVGLVNTLKMGSAGLAEYEAMAEKLGISIDRVDAAKIEAANDAFGRIGKVIEGLANKIAIVLAPLVEAVAESLTDWGTSGTISTEDISKGIEKLAKPIGFVRDSIEFWIRAFKEVRAVVSEVIAFLARKMQSLSQAIADTLNMIPGVETKPLDFTAAFADEMEGAAKRARKAADEAWRKPFPTDGVDAWFRKLNRKIDESKSKMQGTGRLSPSKGPGYRDSTGGDSLGDSIGKAIASAARDAPGILSARSSEGFRQLRSSLRRGTGKESLHAQKATAKNTGELVRVMGQVAANMAAPLAVVGFGQGEG